MDKKNFIETLRRALYGKTDHTSLEEHIRYYETYIDQEMSKGRTEKEVLDELGDPRLIARTILETSGRRSSYMEYTVEESAGDDPESEIRVHRFDGWKATLIMALFFAAVILLLVVVFRILAALLPILIVAGFVLWLMRKYGR